MTAIFVGGFGKNALKAIKVPVNWEIVSIDGADENLFVPDEQSVLIAGLGSRTTETVIEKLTPDCPKMKFILVKPFRFEQKDARASRCLNMIPAECELHVFDNQEMADDNGTLGIADFQKSLFRKIESVLNEIGSKIENLPVIQ